MFLGREGEIQRLRRTLQALPEGHASVQFVFGHAGIGKSRLIAEAIASPEFAEFAVRGGRARDLYADRPCAVLQDALRLSSDVGEPARIAQSVAALCANGPLLLVLDDMQWADPFSVVALSMMLSKPTAGLRVIIALRRNPRNPAVLELAHEQRERADIIDLGPLQADAVAACTRELVGGIPGPNLSRLVDQAGGNPALLTSLLTGLRDADALHVDGGHCETELTEPPLAVRQFVGQELLRIPESSLNLLWVAAVIGGPFHVATLAALMGKPAAALLGDIRLAVTAGLLEDAGATLRFQQELVRASIYSEIPAGMRAALHLSMASTLLAAGVESAEVSRHLSHSARFGTVQHNDEPAGAPAEPAGWRTLTRSEREIARLVVQGLTNREIGRRLFVSPRTVESHVRHIYVKLGVSSRVDLTRMAGIARLPVAEQTRERSRAATAPVQTVVPLRGDQSVA